MTTAHDTERGSKARTALSRCIRVSDAEFAQKYWGVQPLLSSRDDTGGDFSDLFSLAAVDELVAERATRTPFVRMATEGSLLATGRYTAGSGFGAEIADQLDADKVLTEFAAGATLVLQGLHRTWAPLRDFNGRLVEQLGHPAQINAYVTPASARGFDPHYDVHDVFVIQIHGQKHWKIHPPVLENPLADQPWADRADLVATEAEREPAIDTTLSPGDALYLPRGWIHSATALGGTSIHLTVGVAALTRWDVVQELVAGLRDDPGLRSALPIGFGSGRSADALIDSVVGETIADMVSGVSGRRNAALEIERAVVQKLRRSTRPEPLHPISTVERLVNLAVDTPVRWRTGLGARLEGTTVVASRKRVTFPDEAGPALYAFLSSEEPQPAGAMVGLDPQSSLVVARRLLREGLLVFA